MIFSMSYDGNKGFLNPGMLSYSNFPIAVIGFIITGMFKYLYLAIVKNNYVIIDAKG